MPNAEQTRKRVKQTVQKLRQFQRTRPHKSAMIVSLAQKGRR